MKTISQKLDDESGVVSFRKIRISLKMSKAGEDDKLATTTSETDVKKNQMLFNPVDKEERSKRDASEEEDEMEEFNTWTKRYNHVSKEIRKNAIEQEKKELEGLGKSPRVKYYVGSRRERIEALEQQQKLIQDMEIKTKPKK